LLANTLATGAMLMVLILTLGPVSGAHFNPVVTLVMAWAGNLPWREVTAYLAAQVAGAFAGVASAHLMFGMPLFTVATFGLLFVI
jgi:glycerol uptake facilitator-like aquaporin